MPPCLLTNGTAPFGTIRKHQTRKHGSRPGYADLKALEVGAGF